MRRNILRLAEAERRLTEALSLAYRLEDSLVAARACNNLASGLHLRGRPEEAVGLYRGALLSYQRLGDRRGTAETYHNLGLTYRQLSDWEEAESAVTQAVRHAGSVGEPSLMALASGGRAELRIEQGDVELALSELDRAGRMAELAGDVVGGAEFAVSGRSRHCAGGATRRRWSRPKALAALAHRALGQAESAELLRAEAEDGFRYLGAVRLLERFESDWSG